MNVDRAVRCAAVLAIGALALGAAAAPAKITAGTYSGTTSENIAVSFTIAGTKIKNFSTQLGYNGKCGPGGGPGYNVNAANIPIGIGGKFSRNLTLKFSPSIHAPGQISGKVTTGHVSGKVVQFLHGKPNKCYTETFTANKV